jgi:Ca2+/Na+ antiporter
LIAFANGAPDILSSLSSSGKEGGAYISLGALFGGFIFSATLVVSNVVLSAKGQ